MSGYRAVQRRRGTLVLGASIAAMASAGLSPAFAQCSPDPTAANVTTICSGTDEDGLTVGTNGSLVDVQASAVSGPAAIPLSPAISFY